MSSMSKTSKLSSSSGGRAKWALVLIIVAVGIFGASGWAWWRNIHSDPGRVFYGAIENNLRIRSVTRTIQQANGQQKLDQDVNVTVSPEAIAFSSTTVSQAATSGGDDAYVKTETVSTPSEEYVRYADVKTSQKNSKGKVVDYNSVLNIWGKTTSDQTGQPSELFSDSVLGVVPTANLDAHDHKALMRTIRSKNVYKF